AALSRQRDRRCGACRRRGGDETSGSGAGADVRHRAPRAGRSRDGAPERARIRLRFSTLRRRSAWPRARGGAGAGAAAAGRAARQGSAQRLPHRRMKRLARLRAWLEAVPYTILALPLRFGVAWIFWSSAQVKLINWQRTLELFAEEYRVPLLAPELAASMALAIELVCPVLLVLGLFTRAAVLVLLGMTAVIQTFV